MMSSTHRQQSAVILSTVDGRVESAELLWSMRGMAEARDGSEGVEIEVPK
jgi:hypothetical protein